MRQPGGLSGQSWMAAAAADTPLAAAWVALWSAGGRVDPATARAFAAMGEDRAVRESLPRHEPWRPAGGRAHGRRALLPVLAALPRLARDWSRDPAMAPRIAAEIAALPPGDPQIATQTDEPAAAADRAAWLAEAEPVALRRAFCAVACPADPPSCVAAASVLHPNPEQDPPAARSKPCFPPTPGTPAPAAAPPSSAAPYPPTPGCASICWR